MCCICDPNDDGGFDGCSRGKAIFDFYGGNTDDISKEKGRAFCAKASKLSERDFCALKQATLLEEAKCAERNFQLCIGMQSALRPLVSADIATICLEYVFELSR